jgi:hypothetical protein
MTATPAPATEVGMRNHDLEAFASALDRAGRTYLAERGVVRTEAYHLLVEECPVHGRMCARVTYGMLREHVAWYRADAAAEAAILPGTMLPPTESCQPTDGR